ncbi:MAG: phosphoribosylanthranilate isomerase [Alphaproteobacteria bacterium]|nr:phosphoribosylanthranilate isomerase [Alphaproteobacteria bacterium]NDC55670.1 phosphoribosylanthranilate isomerase [Alphaproteobacteria bacterium]
MNNQHCAPIIKICGIMSLAGIEACKNAGADWAGLVFVAGSRHRVDDALARQLAVAARPNLKVIGLFENHNLDEILNVVKNVPLDILQLHGDETVSLVREIKNATGLPVIKVVAVGDAVDIEKAELFSPVSDYVLFDAKPPANATQRGGNGVSFNWQILKNFRGRVPWLLAGGLNAQNISEAIEMARPTGVDVSSGVETDHVKDPHKINTFCTLARQKLASFSASRV